MGYRIIYGEEQLNRRGIRVRMVTLYAALCLVLFGALTVEFWPEGREVLQDVFLPGDPAVTWQALVNMAEDLKAGEAIGDAVVVFCREIVAGAQLPD